MSRIGARIIKRYGNTPEARELFFQEAEKCDPPLEDAELNTIWGSCQKFFKKLCSTPGYISPEAYNGTGPLQWETPIPFDAFDLPTFPADTLPTAVRDYVQAVAETTQTSVDMAAVASLAILSICLQGKYRIWGKADWWEPLNTYCVIVLPPAERKSAVISLMTAPLEEYEQEVNAAMDAQIIESQMKKTVLDPTLLGYRYEQGSYIIEPTEADTVRLIFDSYLQDMGTTAIAKLLNESTAVSRFGNGWGQRSIMAILQNYTYTGNLLLQKKYTVDFLTKTMKINEGEVPQYYVEDSHPAIIKPAEWEAVQVEMEQRRSKGRRHDCGSPFSGKIFCGDCGGVYGSKTWHSTDKYRRVIWQCNHKYDSGEKCGTPHLREEVLKERFLEALAQYMDDPDERIEGLRYVQKAMTDTTFVDADLEEAGQKMELLSGMIRNCIMMNASAAVGEREYQQQYAELTRQFEEQKVRYEALQDRRKQMNETAIIFGGMLFELWELEEIPVSFKESLWHTLVDHATVYVDERIIFRFKDGTEVTTML